MATPKFNEEFEAKKENAKKLIAAGGCHAIAYWSRTDAQRLCPKEHSDFQPVEAPIYTDEWLETAKRAIKLIQSGIDMLEQKS